MPDLHSTAIRMNDSMLPLAQHHARFQPQARWGAFWIRTWVEWTRGQN
jgi:hypothetical protein